MVPQFPCWELSYSCYFSSKEQEAGLQPPLLLQANSVRLCLHSQDLHSTLLAGGFFQDSLPGSGLDLMPNL